MEKINYKFIFFVLKFNFWRENGNLIISRSHLLISEMFKFSLGHHKFNILNEGFIGVRIFLKKIF